MDLSVITAIGVLVALTNVVVQVAKQLLPKVPTNLVALVVAVLLTVAAGVAYCQINVIAITWYMCVGLVMAGFMVAYAAMFGFDKLKEIMNWTKE